MIINEKLNLVVPVQSDDGDILIGHVHSTPISRGTFEAYYQLVAGTFAAMLRDGEGAVTAKIAELSLRRVAKDKGLQVGPFLDEIVRLTSFVKVGGEVVPFIEVVPKGVISEDDAKDVMSIIVFFTVASAIWSKKDFRTMAPTVLAPWGAETTSLAPTAFAASLRTSTGDGSSGATA